MKRFYLFFILLLNTLAALAMDGEGMMRVRAAVGGENKKDQETIFLDIFKKSSSAKRFVLLDEKPDMRLKVWQIIYGIDFANDVIVLSHKGRSEQRDLIIYFIDKGINPNELLLNGHTLLTFAINTQRSDLIDLLFYKLGDLINFDAQDNVIYPGIFNGFGGRTALHWAVYNNDIKLVTLLLSKNARILITDKEGKTAFDYACDGKKENIKELLKSRLSGRDVHPEDRAYMSAYMARVDGCAGGGEEKKIAAEQQEQAQPQVGGEVVASVQFQSEAQCNQRVARPLLTSAQKAANARMRKARKAEGDVVVDQLPSRDDQGPEEGPRVEVGEVGAIGVEGGQDEVVRGGGGGDEPVAGPSLEVGDGQGGDSSSFSARQVATIVALVAGGCAATYAVVTKYFPAQWQKIKAKVWGITKHEHGKENKKALVKVDMVGA